MKACAPHSSKSCSLNLTCRKIECGWFQRIFVPADLPTEVDTYHNLCLLEASPTNGPPKSNTFGFVTSVYKATNIKNGIYYCLRRVHGEDLGDVVNVLMSMAYFSYHGSFP